MRHACHCLPAFAATSPPVPSALGRRHCRLSTSRQRPADVTRVSFAPRRRHQQPFACAEREVDPLAASPLGAPKVLCVGEALLDVVGGIAVPGGAPCNLAVGLARLGTASAVVGAVGDDADGSALVRVLEASDVNVDGLQRLDGRRTRRVLVDLDASGDREFVGFEGRHFADEAGCDVGLVPGVLFYAAQFIVVGTLGLAYAGSRTALAQLLEVAKATQLRVWVDVNWRPVFWSGQAASQLDAARAVVLAFLRKRAEFVKVSVEEVSFLLGEDVAATALANPSAVLSELGGGVRGVLVTDGAKGASWLFSGGMEAVTGRVNSFRPPGGDVVDTVGAGDAFLAGFMAELFELGGATKLMDGAVVERCARFAAAAAAIAVSGAGGLDPLPRRAEVEAFLKDPVAAAGGGSA
jgi:fructokinase